MPPIKVLSLDPTQPTNNTKPQWGVAQIRAPEVWNKSTRGKGVNVGTIDTGVRGTHEALRDNQLEEYGWYDPIFFSPEATDVDGHGTHTMGTIAGKTNGVGVAPDVTWISCRGCTPAGCMTDHLLYCGDFMLCPHDPYGFPAPDCSAAPHLVSNSWGGDGVDDFFDSTIYSWNAAGIIPVFAAGNAGPSCATVGSPGGRANVISVGSSDMSNMVSSFSSRGPGDRIEIAPDFTAPGEIVLSSYYFSDTNYTTLSGTSMATPHVAGIIALLLSQSPKMKFLDVRDALRNGTVPTTPTGTMCNGVYDNVYPNYASGYGRVDAMKTLKLE